MRGWFLRKNLPEPYGVICYAIMRQITLEDQFQVLQFYYFPILNYFRNLDQIFFLFLFLNSMEDTIFMVRIKEEGKLFYLIHQGFMNKLYTHYLAQNLPLQVNPLATATLQVCLDPSPSSSYKKIKKKSNPKVKVSLIDSNMSTRKRKQSARRTS